MEDRLGLSTVSALLTVVPALSLCEERRLAGLVLGHLMRPSIQYSISQIARKVRRRTYASGTFCPCSLYFSSVNIHPVYLSRDHSHVLRVLQSTSDQPQNEKRGDALGDVDHFCLTDSTTTAGEMIYSRLTGNCRSVCGLYSCLD